MLSRIQADNLYSVIITGVLNCIENDEGKTFEILTTDLGLQQQILEPTHIMSDFQSCIDLIFSDKPNLFLESGIHPSL